MKTCRTPEPCPSMKCEPECNASNAIVADVFGKSFMLIEETTVASLQKPKKRLRLDYESPRGSADWLDLDATDDLFYDHGSKPNIADFDFTMQHEQKGRNLEAVLSPRFALDYSFKGVTPGWGRRNSLPSNWQSAPKLPLREQSITQEGLSAVKPWPSIDFTASKQSRIATVPPLCPKTYNPERIQSAAFLAISEHILPSKSYQSGPKRKYAATEPINFIIQVVSPTNNDVLFGRGSHANLHKGNQAWLAKKRELQPSYFSAKNKRTVAAKLVNWVQERGGRFLELSKSGNTKAYFEITDNSRIFRKAGQTLREIS